MKDSLETLEERFEALELCLRDLLAILDEGGCPVERIHLARQRCQASLEAALAGLDSAELGEAERARAAQRLEGLLSLSAVTRGRVGAEHATLVRLQLQVRAERGRLRALDPRSEPPGSACDLAG